MRSRSTPVACTLTAADRPAHEALVRELAGYAVGVGSRPGEARVSFRGARRALLDAFVAAESACCPFFGFVVDEHADHVRLTITAPPAAQTLLAGLAASLAGGAQAPPTPR
jgi:hypothetical protein